MADSQNGMAENHPWAGKTHDLPNLFTHFLFVAMHCAVGAEGFCLHERALIAPLPGVGIQGGAVGAELPASVMLSTVQGDHLGDKLLLPL